MTYRTSLRSRLALCVGIVLSTGFFAWPSPVGSQDIPGFVAYEAANEDQKEQILYVEKNIRAVSRQIESYQKFMERMGLINAEGRSRIPLEATMQAEWGRRERRIYNGTATIAWNAGRIASVMFQERRGIAGSGYLLRKTWYVREVGDDQQNFQGVSVNIVIGEKADSLYTRYYNYRFFTGRDVRDQDRDIGLPDYATQKDSPVIDVREPAERIQLLREYLAALRLLERRINYLAFSQIQGEKSLLNK